MNLIFSKNKYSIIIFSILFISLILFLFPHSYWANDNVGILRNIKLGFTPSFMSAILGSFLAFFYLNINNCFPWYGLFLYLIHAISISLFIYFIFELIANKSISFLIIFLYLSIYSLMIIKVGYNGTSFMIGGNSLLLFLAYLRRTSLIDWKVILILSLLFSFSYLIRIHSIYGIAAFSFPIIIISIIQLRQNKYKYILLFVLPVSLFMVLDNYYKDNFTSDVYKQFIEFNKIKGKFHGYPIAENNKSNLELFKKNNWSKNDYNALVKWFYLDENIYSKNKLTNIFIYSKYNKSEVVINKLNISINFKKFIDNYGYYIAILLLLLIYIGIHSKLIHFLIILTYVFYGIGGMLYMSLFYRFPTRIGIPIFLLFLSLILLLYSLNKINDKQKITVSANFNKIVVIFSFIVFVGLSFSSINLLLKQTERIKLKQIENLKIIHKINCIPKNSTVILQPAQGFQSVWFSPLKEIPLRKDLIIIPLGWNIFSEIFYHQLKLANIQKGFDIVPSILNNNKFFLVLLKDSSFKKAVDTFIKEHYEKNIHWVDVENISKRTIYQIVGY